LQILRAIGCCHGRIDSACWLFNRNGFSRLPISQQWRGQTPRRRWQTLTSPRLPCCQKRLAQTQRHGARSARVSNIEHNLEVLFTAVVYSVP
jgi:hypothetical protein